LSKLPVGRVGAAPLSKGGVALSGGLCGSALTCRFGDGLVTSVAVLVFAGCERSLAGCAGAVGTAVSFGLDVAGFLFGADGSTGVSLCVTEVSSSLFDPNRLRRKLPMLPEFPVEAGVPSEVHPASAIAAATAADVRSARTGNCGRSTSS
jgi:hypothetical protein